MSAPTAIVVDDDPLVLPVIMTVLSDANFRVLSATDSDSALRILETENGSIELLFTDVVMPGSMDGIGLARLADSRWPSIAIVVSSGRYVPRADSLPLNTLFLPKPFSADHVLWFAQRALLSKGHRLSDRADRSAQT